ncbi:MAG: hypothetical protein IJR82_05720 [Bacilli bacterium]|nr:hypothetical protein [Bacilli bacterium]
MNSDIDLLNEKLKLNYNNFNEVANSAEILNVCLNDESLYPFINRFNEIAWNDYNQGLFANIFVSYIGKYRAPRIRTITNQDLLTQVYNYKNIGWYLKGVKEALNEENIRIAYEKKIYDSFLFRKNSMALKVFLENNYDFKIDFTLDAWNEENARLYIKKLTQGVSKISSFYTSIICFKVVIEEHLFHLVNNFYLSNQIGSDIGQLLCDKMIEYPQDIVEMKIYLFKGLETYYLKGLIVAKRYDLLNAAINDNSLNEENLGLIADNFSEYVKATNGKISVWLTSYPIILTRILELEMYDSIIYATNVWTEKNIKLYFSKNLDPKKYEFLESNALALKVYLINNFTMDIHFRNINDRIVWTEENIELYFSYIQRLKPEKIIYSFTNIPNFCNLCLTHNLFKFLPDSNYNDTDKKLLYEKLREFPNEYFKISSLVIFNNPDLTEALIDSKRFSLINQNYLSLASNDHINLKFADILDEYFKAGCTNIPRAFLQSSDVLKRKIELGRLDNLFLFSKSAWNIEILTMLINRYVHNDLSFGNIPDKDHPYLEYAMKYLNVYVPFSSSIKSNYCKYEEYKDPFFKYLTDNNLGDIYNILKYYKQNDTIKEYIQDGYMTDKFKKVLLFNHNYQMYCKEKGIDILKDVEDLELLAYLKCAYSVSSLYKGIFVNELNYKQYFDKSGPKQELYDFLFNINSLATFYDLINAYPNEEIDEIKIYAAKRFSKLENEKVLKLCFEYFNDNYKIMDENKVEELLKMVKKIEYSNALEIHEFAPQILSAVLDSDNPYDKLNQIENVFLRDNIPMFAKMFICFKILYPNFQKYDRDNRPIFDFNENSRLSPTLLKADPDNPRMVLYSKLVKGDKTKIRFQLVFNDLLRCAINSNNLSLINYLNNLKIGNEYLIKFMNEDYNEHIFTEEELNVLKKFIDNLVSIYENMTNNSLKDMNLSNQCEFIIKYFNPNEKYSLLDRIVRSFGYFAGIDSFEQILKMIEDKKNKVDMENIEYGRYLDQHPFELEDNDLLRCIGNYSVLGSSLENGNFCKELLGTFIGKSDTDTTPLDVDFTLIEKKDTLYSCIDKTPTGWGFGNLFVVLKRDVNITRDRYGNILPTKYDPMKLEVFGTHTESGGYETHWGGQSGMDFSDVKALIYKKMAQIDPNKPYNDDGSVNYINTPELDDLPIIKFELVKKGIRVPIVDLSKRKIFDENEFDDLRKKMMGLSYYGCSQYMIDKDSLMFDGIEELVQQMINDQERVMELRASIVNKIKNIILDPKYGLGINQVDTKFNGNLENGICELIETGSTSRFSNVPNDADFDFMLKVDRNIISNKDTVKKIIDIFKQEFKPEHMIPTVPNRFRGEKIEINGVLTDIDISEDQRIDIYSSEKALEDRYNSIKMQYPEYYLYALANVVKAKQFLKDNHIYKAVDGGMGGIGVENWILQNGSSFQIAALDFLSHAYNIDGSLKSFDNFKRSYYVFDYGCNHEPRKKYPGVYYPYDNYIADNLKEPVYYKMVSALKNYLASINQNSKVL